MTFPFFSPDATMVYKIYLDTSSAKSSHARKDIKQAMRIGRNDQTSKEEETSR